MLLSRMRPAGQPAFGNPESSNPGQAFPKVQHFLEKRDFIGALTLLEFQKSISKGSEDPSKESLIPYCAFRLGDYKRSLDEYLDLMNKKGSKMSKEAIERLWLNTAACYFCLGMYDESLESAKRGNDCGLKTRLLFHLAHKLGDDETLMNLHRGLEETLENQLSLASVHYLRGDFQHSIDIYKKILLDKRSNLIPPPDPSLELQPSYEIPIGLFNLIQNRCPQNLSLLRKLIPIRELAALNVYIALCYHRLEYYDVSQEVLAVYLQSHPDSFIGLNLKACNTLRLYTGAAAEKELKPLLNIMQQDEQTKHGIVSSIYDLIKHNLVVFRRGEGAMQVLPKLIDVIPEAKLNLIIYYLEMDDVINANTLTKTIKPQTMAEFILCATVNVILGQQHGNREALASAQNYFSRIGSLETEQDTIPGRLCMASAHFLSGNYEQCLLYLNSIRTHYYNDDTFNFNYAQVLGMMKQYQEAENVLGMIQNEKLRNDFIYVQWLARCLIMNKKPRVAWDMYERIDTGPESFQLLQLIANECYRTGQFYYAAKAFDIMEKFDPSQENWEGKRGACIGVFQLIIAGHEPKESLPDIISLLRQSSRQNVEKILTVMKKWAKDNRINL